MYENYPNPYPYVNPYSGLARPQPPIMTQQPNNTFVPVSNYTSRDNGYSRDASRQKMVDKLYTLLDDTMSDGERHAINECIEKIR